MPLMKCRSNSDSMGGMFIKQEGECVGDESKEGDDEKKTWGRKKTLTNARGRVNGLR